MFRLAQSPQKANSGTTDPVVVPQAAADTKLKDVNFVKQMKATLSPGLFELVDAATSQRIISSCITHCDGSSDVLAKVLQTKFIADHSAFYWVLAGSKGVKDLATAPPLLEELLKACGPLSEEIQDEIIDALFKLNSDTLFRKLGKYLPSISGPTVAEPAFEYQLATTTGYTPNHQGFAHLSFNIPQFFDRLLVDQEVVLPPCLSNGSLWSLKAKVKTNASTSGDSSPRWEFELTEVRTKSPQTTTKSKNCRSITVVIYASGGGQKQLELKQAVYAPLSNQPFHRQVSTVPVPIKDADLASFHGNGYLGPGRTLSGTVVIADTYSSTLY